MEPSEHTQRVAKLIAWSGACSRRQAEGLIKQGKVKVNGVVIDSPATKASSTDIIAIDDKPLTQQKAIPRLWIYYKPRGLITTHNDPQGRVTVFEKLPNDLPRVISVGRLDINSEGLLLLTTNSNLARFMESPSTGLVRRYRVRVFGNLNMEKLASLEKGIIISGIKYKPIRIALDKQTGRNAWLTVDLQEGKNREIRKVLEYFGLQVNRLIRISYGPFTLGTLLPGRLQEIPIYTVERQLGWCEDENNSRKT